MSKKPPTGSLYRCKYCGDVVRRETYQAWVKSYCEKADRHVHLIRVKEPNEHD